MPNNEFVSELIRRAADDTGEARKARGAFFTPDPITRFMTDWAVRSTGDRVLEPSVGDAAFLVQAVRRLRHLGQNATTPLVSGVEIHEHSASVAAARIRKAGGDPAITVSDFFLVEPAPLYSVAIGNPPYIRYQDFAGQSRARSRAAALRAGVALSGLASSWAAFTIHSALFLEQGGRMALVLPAELLSVNYAAPVRQFLFERFKSIELVLFEEQVFPEAEADVLLLLADGYGEGAAEHAVVHQTKNASTLGQDVVAHNWTPPEPSGKWTSLLVRSAASGSMASLAEQGRFTSLEQWGDTTLGMVTGNNRFFTLSPERVRELGLPRNEIVRLSPPGSSHLRGLTLSNGMMTRLGKEGSATWLFRPATGELSAQAVAYIEAGEKAGVNEAYKCRVRSPWYRVPLVRPADLLLTYMNADTPRLTTNEAGAHHLNSVHGVYLQSEFQELGRDLLPIASLNSITLLSAEMVGRSYGGGLLKLEPREADHWTVPSPSLVADRADQLRAIKPKVARLLQSGKLDQAVTVVDDVLLLSGDRAVSSDDIANVRVAYAALAGRRAARAKSGS